ncbi:MAG: ABC transporter ATP-binding protein, partial [Lachnospiraceae bacterium]|nr:ABC transporter ATP-binding protein [Lachnospiraceae bacterium]
LLFNKAQNVELRCFEDTEFYNKYTLAMDKADSRLIETVDTFWGVIFGFIAAIVSFVFLFQIDKFAVLFVIFPIIGNFVFNRKLGVIDYERNKEMALHNRKNAYVNRVMYMPEYSKEMRLTNVFNLMKKRFNESMEGISRVAEKYKGRGAINHILRCSFTFSFIFEGMLIYGSYRTLVSKTMIASELAVITSMMVASTWILIEFTDSCMKSYQNGLYMDNLRNFLEYEEVIPEDYAGDKPAEEIESIEFRNVCFSYDGKENIIENLSLKMEGSKTYALVGYNGAGKSTLIKLLLRFYDPTSGEILLNGRNIKEYELKEYRKLFACAFQDHMLFSASIKENVLMRECTKDDDEKVIKALKNAGVYDKVSELPEGIETIMTKEFDENGAVLSGGESQKIVVARAFASDASVNVFDEPSSALDPIAEYELFDNIIRNKEKKTMLFISHRLSSVKDADRVFLLSDKNILEAGTHEELMKLNGKYANMYRKQAENYLAINIGEEEAV